MGLLSIRGGKWTWVMTTAWVESLSNMVNGYYYFQFIDF